MTRCRTDQHRAGRTQPLGDLTHRLRRTQGCREESVLSGQPHEGQKRDPGQTDGVATGEGRVKPPLARAMALAGRIDRVQQNIGVDDLHAPRR